MSNYHQETIYDKSFLQNVDLQIYGGRLLIFSATYFAGKEIMEERRGVSSPMQELRMF